LYNEYNGRICMATSSDFGAFFRSIREGLGLSLREFCRRTGFDQANVSRLERGLLPPPKGEKVLTAYAKGLKLKPASAEWERFMTLAKPPAKPRRGHGHRNWVTAKHLEDWAGTVDARNTLPQLVRRLIRATGEEAVRLEAPAGEQTQRPGWDVLLEASGAAEFVPQGMSGWELSVEEDPKRKANEDLAKRQKETPQITRRKTTFLFVTPRKYQQKGKWVEEKMALKRWKEVRFYDSASLEEWLECAPAVDVWLARQLGLCPAGLIDVDEYWKDLEALTDPSFEPAVYLASRAKQFAALKEWLGGPPDTLVLESRSPIEGVDFVVAASRQPELEEDFAARALIVETREAWRSLAGGEARLLLVVAPALALEAELVAEAVRNGHHVILGASGAAGLQHRRIELSRVSGLELQKALEAQGVERWEADKWATASGGSLAVLKRLRARHPGTVHPQWSRPPHARAVVPLLLAGRWSDTSEGDRLALAKLADAPYREVVERAERWSRDSDPLLTRAPSRWELVSRDDSWGLVSPALNDDDLRRFEQVSLEVLAEPDPACDLPSDERWKARILGKVRTHSGTLRTGLVESLALLGARPPERKGLSLDPIGLVTSIVRSLLDGKDWKAWASLSLELPLLAEAAPDAFLTALEKDLHKRSPVVVKLFDPDASPFFGPNKHTGLLFALEGLAWDRNSLPRVSLLLARLHELAPSTKLGNSPMRTLQQVFMPWYPQTTAPVEERVAILERLSKRHPKAGWTLLRGLLPMVPSMVSSNYRPAFRNWALQWSEGATGADRVLQEEACAHLVVEMAGKDVSRLKDTVEVIESLPLSARKKLLDRFTSIDPATLNAAERRILTEAFREKVNQHRRFAEADWTPKEPLLQEFDRIRQRLEPDDDVTKNAWLFGDYWNLYWQVNRHGRAEEEAVEEVQQLRATAINEIRSEQKWDGVLALAEVAASPDQVGAALGACAVEGDDARVLPALLVDTRKGLADFAKGYVRVRQCQQGWKWVGTFALDRWSDDQLVELALALPSEPEAWDLVARRGPKAEEQYWENVLQLCFSKNPADVFRACTMLTNAGRPFDAVRQLAIARHRDVQLDPALIIAVLQRGWDAPSSSDQQRALGRVQYEVGVLIQLLQNLVEAADARVDFNAVANLEWRYLALLDGHPAVPTILHTWLETQPQFFVELLVVLFRRSDQRGEERLEPSESDQARGVQVYRLLNSWKRVPGSRPDGSVDADVLRQWVRSVQTLAENEARREVADIRIGNVLAHAPHEPDGTWPCLPVRDAIEELGSEDLTDGFEIGIRNKRDAYWKAPDEGGSQERAIAKQYFEWADALKIEWPKTSASLHRVAEQYEAEARREDAEAESR
jgi:transcriptional regulator with XRE-family HTH domain